VTGNIDTTSDLYKIFHRASTRNLLYLQTRVAALQQKQIKFDQEYYKFRIKNLDSRFHAEDEILDNFFSPSKKHIHVRLDGLEGSRNNSPLGLPSLPQDLSWGPVSDRGFRTTSCCTESAPPSIYSNMAAFRSFLEPLTDSANHLPK
jgi:hypothetical protein